MKSESYNRPNIEMDYISGSERKKRVKSKDWIVYNIPVMEAVKIFSTNFIGKDKNKKKIEIYYPPEFEFNKRIPTVIIFSIKKDSMDRGSYVSWALLLASKGIITITYQALDYEKDFKSILEYINSNKSYLWIDENKIGILAFCGALNHFFDMNPNYIYENYFPSFGIFFSGTIAPPSKYNYSFPVLIVNSGNDYKVCVKSFSRFKKEAKKYNIQYIMIDFPEGIHRFDVFQSTEKSKKIIKTMLREIRSLTKNND